VIGDLKNADSMTEPTPPSQGKSKKTAKEVHLKKYVMGTAEKNTKGILIRKGIDRLREGHSSLAAG